MHKELVRQEVTVGTVVHSCNSRNVRFERFRPPSPLPPDRIQFLRFYSALRNAGQTVERKLAAIRE